MEFFWQGNFNFKSRSVLCSVTHTETRGYIHTHTHCVRIVCFLFMSICDRDKNSQESWVREGKRAVERSDNGVVEVRWASWSVVGEWVEFNGSICPSHFTTRKLGWQFKFFHEERQRERYNLVSQWKNKTETVRMHGVLSHHITPLIYTYNIYTHIHPRAKRVCKNTFQPFYWRVNLICILVSYCGEI